LFDELEVDRRLGLESLLLLNLESRTMRLSEDGRESLFRPRSACDPRELWSDGLKGTTKLLCLVMISYDHTADLFVSPTLHVVLE
jgi:hypothetical protein